MTTHPSRLALDRHVFVPDVQLEPHLAECADCRAHLEAVRTQLPVPQWLGEVGAPRHRWWPWWVGVAAVAASVLLVVGPRQEPATSPKGLPSVTVWLKRAEAVRPWDGASPVRAGDALRLEAAPGEYRFVTVVSQAEEGGLTLLYSAKVEAGGKPVLTPAWELDARGRAEHLEVLFTRRPLEDEALQPLLSRRDGEVWCLHVVLPRETP